MNKSPLRNPLQRKVQALQLSLKNLLKLTLFLATPLVASAQSLEVLGDFIPLDVSHDGSVVLGESHDGGVRSLVVHRDGSLDTVWSQPASNTNLIGESAALSGDGKVIYAATRIFTEDRTNRVQLIRIDPDGSVVNLPDLPPPNTVNSSAYFKKVNEDGTVAVASTDARKLYRWTESGVSEVPLPSNFYFSAIDSSLTRILGHVGFQSKQMAVWSEGQPLKTFGVSSERFSPIGITPDGRKIAGNYLFGNEEFNLASARTVIYDLETGAKTEVITTGYERRPHSLDCLGRLYGGLEGQDNLASDEMWTEDEGWRELSAALSEDYGLGFEDWGFGRYWPSLYGARIRGSADCQTLIGLVSRNSAVNESHLEQISAAFRLQYPLPEEVNLTIALADEDLGVGDETTAIVTVSSSLPDPVTITLNNPLLTASVAELVQIGEMDEIDPFELNSETTMRKFSVPVRILKKGIVDLMASGVAVETGGTQTDLDATFTLEVDPVTVEVTITNKRHQWKNTPEEDWGERAKAINAQRRDAGEAPYENLIELEVLVKNNSGSDIENLNVPEARDILSYISSADASDPSVPLKPIRLYNADGAEVDLTNPQDDTVVGDVTLPAEQTTTFAWVVEAFQIDPEERDEPYELEFKPLILGSLAGANLQVGKTEPFSIRVREPIVVNVTSDERDADPEDGVIDVDLETEGEQVSLRAAIEYANEQEGLDRIEFDIPGDGVPEIKVGPPPEGTNVMATGPDGDLFPFPVVENESFQTSFDSISSALKATDPIEIDGTTQPGGWVLITGQEVIDLRFSQDIDYELNAVNGLEIAGGDSLIRGLVINRFPGMGLVLTEKGGNRIVGNILGMDPTGMFAYGNGSKILINRKVEPSAFARPEEILGNSFELTPEAIAEGWSVYSNLLSRIYAGGLLVNSPANEIGGPQVEDRNIISGHGRHLNSFRVYYDYLEVRQITHYVSDLVVSGSNARDNLIQGNYIGTNALGKRSNEGYSPLLQAKEVVSGILVSNGARNNRLSENLTPAIVVEDASGTQLLENVIGLPSEPKGSIDRGGLGLIFDQGSVVENNQIAGRVGLNESNTARLINNSIDADQALSLFKSSDVVIQGNQIGLDSDDNHHDGDNFWSVSLYRSTNVSLGGPDPGEGNTIAMSGFRSFNPPGHKAIDLPSREIDQTEGVRLIHSGNNYVAHPSRGVSKEASVLDLENDGIDPIDFGDLDGKQNYPRISTITPNAGALRFDGNLDSHLGGASYYLDFYKTATPFPSGHGGATMTYIGRGTVQTDGGGFGQFEILIPVNDFEDSDYFTATAIRMDGSGETSEFSRNRRLNDNILKELNRAAYGDRNGDGTDDVDQENVSSFSAANGADTTVEVSAANGQTSEKSLPIAQSHFQTLDDANPTLANISSETQASMDAPRNYSYSNGVLTFEVPDLSAGASVSIRLILADDAAPDTLWILQSDDTWTSALPATIDGNQVTLILTDGGPGDRDGEANGRIVAAIGPATALPPIPEMDFTITKEANVHTLSWPLTYVNAQLEFSRDLSADSWEPIDFLDLEPLNDRWQLTVPNPVNEFFPDLPEDLPDSGFYRLRYVE